MAKYTVLTFEIHVLGIGHYGQTCATIYKLDKHKVEECREDNGSLTRESIERYLFSNSGDFQRITDWSASMGDELEVDFEDEENKYQFEDIWYGTDW